MGTRNMSNNSGHSYTEGAEVPEDKTTDNELIAQFMGYEKVTVDYFGTSFETEWQREHQDWMEAVNLDSIGDYIVKVKDNEWIYWKDVAYHTSWDWIVPVARKLTEKAKHTDMPHAIFMNVYTFSVCRPIAELYENIIKGIKWYNQQKLKTRT